MRGRDGFGGVKTEGTGVAGLEGLLERGAGDPAIEALASPGFLKLAPPRELDRLSPPGPTSSV